LCLLASILAPTWRPRAIQSRPRAAQERPRAAQERPRAAQELPKSAKDGPGAPKSRPRQPKSFPEADQDGQELPRTRPGLVQDLPRSATEPTHYPRLEKNSQLHPAILQNFLPCHKAANFKNERRRYSPQGGLQSAAQLGTACWIGIPRSSCPSKPISLDQVLDAKVLGACLLSSPS
jgi:hypothetical protein